jgi:MYXO-CTERM domain-containing protein
MIVLDRSCSMKKVPAGDTQSKWLSSIDAITNLATNYAGELRLGLIMFPDESGQSCVQDGGIYVNVGPDNETAVLDAVNGTTPTGPCVTNIDTAMEQVWDDPAFDPDPVDPPTRRSFVLLITDGKQSSKCGGVGMDPLTEQTILELYAANFPTYVVGFGGEVRPASLELFATAGGVPRVGDPVYYQADTAAELDEIIDVIAGTVAGDPEFGGCVGLPCPDERCPGQYDECVEGVCVTHLPDGGPSDPPDEQDGGIGSDDGGIGGGATGELSGCGCRADRSTRGSAFGTLVLLLFGFVALRRRRPFL